MGIGLPEILIVLLIVVVVFGARKLPELGRGLGSGMREFKDGIQGKDDDAVLTPPPAQQPAPAQPQAAESQPVAPPAPVAPAEPAPPAPPRTEE